MLKPHDSTRWRWKPWCVWRGWMNARAVSSCYNWGTRNIREAIFYQAMETCQKAAELARRLGLSEYLARAAIGVEDARARPGLPVELSLSLLDEVLSVLPDGDNVLRAQVLAGMSSALYYRGVREQAVAVGQQAVEMASRIGDATTLAKTMHLSLYALRVQPDYIGKRLAYATEMLQLANELDHMDLTLNASLWQIMELLELGDIQTLDTRLEAFTRLAHEIRHPHNLYLAASVQMTRALLNGRFAAAEKLAHQALAVGHQLPGPGVDGTFGIQMFTLRQQQGRLRELAPLVKHFVRQHGSTSAWRPGLALIYREIGQKREARMEFERLAAHDFTDLPQDTLWVVCIVYLTEVCAFLGDGRHAATLYDLLLPYAGHNVVAGAAYMCYGDASRYLGMLAHAMEHWQEAEQHFEQALTMNAKMGARPWLAHTQYDYAMMLATRDYPGDADKASLLLHEALLTARELGMQALEERITAHISSKTVPPPPPLMDLDDLSPRELDVLRLLATGKSNREIAEALFISLSTVATHVRNILTKTGCANRTEAAAFALRHGLSEA
ncbi:hypothetical protein C2W62_16720 [Candidatus Entotheonella serta]|nr:hypothetical protein C2W62_16720 [Candidatus Entotheonella serta]